MPGGKFAVQATKDGDNRAQEPKILGKLSL